MSEGGYPEGLLERKEDSDISAHDDSLTLEHFFLFAFGTRYNPLLCTNHKAAGLITAKVHRLVSHPLPLIQQKTAAPALTNKALR